MEMPGREEGEMLHERAIGLIDDRSRCGNPYPFCRCFPWLPRGWWVDAPPGELGWIEGMSRQDELRILRLQRAGLHAQLEQIRSLVSGLDRKEDIRQGGKTK